MAKCLKCKRKLKSTCKFKIIDATTKHCLKYIETYYCKKCDEYVDIKKTKILFY